MYYFLIKKRKNVKTNWAESWKYNDEESAWGRLEFEKMKDKNDEYDYYIAKSITFGEQTTLF